MKLGINYKDMSAKQVQEMAVECCAKNGFELEMIKKLPNPADDYLRYVLAYNEKSKEYATWMLNISMGGLAYGHYFSHYLPMMGTKEEAYQRALTDFKERG